MSFLLVLCVLEVIDSQRATWHVPKSQSLVAEKGAARDEASPSATPLSESASSSSHKAPSLFSNSSSRSVTQQKEKDVSSGVKKDVALKAISKKKVKGNEEAVWGEMDVLKGLNHPNIVRFLLVMMCSTNNITGQVL